MYVWIGANSLIRGTYTGAETPERIGAEARRFAGAPWDSTGAGAVAVADADAYTGWGRTGAAGGVNAYASLASSHSILTAISLPRRRLASAWSHSSNVSDVDLYTSASMKIIACLRWCLRRNKRSTSLFFPWMS
jgi:hypothetical protein